MKKCKPYSIPITLEGKTFKSIREACRYYNLDYNKVYRRLDNDWTIEEAFELVKRDNERFINITLEGRTFKSIREACKYYNLDYDKIYTRLNYGWTIEEAFELVDIVIRPITINGIFYKSIKEAAEYYNTTSLLGNRLRREWDLVSAIITPALIELKGKEITIDGEIFNSIAEACRYYNLNYNKISTRLNIGWTIEEAFELVPRNITYKSKICKHITLEGRTFESIREACKYYKLNYSSVKYRLRNDWSVEEAFELVPRKRNK